MPAQSLSRVKRFSIHEGVPSRTLGLVGTVCTMHEAECATDFWHCYTEQQRRIWLDTGGPGAGFSVTAPT